MVTETEAFAEKYAMYYDLFNNSKDYTKEVSFLDQTFKKYGKNVKSLLDLGCGTGIHDNMLSKKGYTVTGLDLSPEMIKIANSRKEKNTEFVVGDMSNFDLSKKFDAVISMFAAFGYLTKNEQIASALESIKKHLNPGGLFIMDCWHGPGVLRELPSSRTKNVKVGDIDITRKSTPDFRASEHVCGVKFDVKIEKEGELIDEYTEDHQMRFIFPQEFKKYLSDAGFELIEMCKTFELDTTVNENDWNVVFIAKLK